jgi:hypothetical protein
MTLDAIHQRFSAALDSLVADLKGDRSVVAALLCGSLSHDVVWDKSDIDLVIVTADDGKGGPCDLALYANGINIHAFIVPRVQFRRIADGSDRNSFIHSFLTKGRLLYTHDPTIEELCATLTGVGAYDTRVQLLRAGTHALPPVYKAHKFLETRGDLNYTALWILHAAGALARIEVVSRRLLADREVLPQALALNPEFFTQVYTDLLNTPKTRVQVEAALVAIDQYLADRTQALFGLVLDHLHDVGDVRSASDLEAHFTRHFDVTGVVTACEYLADRGLIGKASAPVRVTRTSRVDVQELAFFSLDSGAPAPPAAHR